MLGRAVAAHWRRRGDAVLALGHAQADITDRAKLHYWAESFRPEVVINCAAFTRVDDCETEHDTAMEINGRAVAHVRAAAESVGALLVHVSSDYVFDGRATTPYAEDAPTGPQSAYGASKLLGEEEALHSGPERVLVVRTSWLFGPGGPNFARTIAGALRAGKPLRVVDDQIGRPTYTPYLARALRDLVRHGARGIVHYGNHDAVSWHGFATEIARLLAPGATVEPVPTTEFPRPARRPAYSVLDVGRFEALVGRRVESWAAGLAEYLDTEGEQA